MRLILSHTPTKKYTVIWLYSICLTILLYVVVICTGTLRCVAHSEDNWTRERPQQRCCHLGSDERKWTETGIELKRDYRSERAMETNGSRKLTLTNCYSDMSSVCMFEKSTMMSLIENKLFGCVTIGRSAVIPVYLCHMYSKQFSNWEPLRE